MQKEVVNGDKQDQKQEISKKEVEDAIQKIKIR